MKTSDCISMVVTMFMIACAVAMTYTMYVVYPNNTDTAYGSTYTEEK